MIPRQIQSFRFSKPALALILASALLAVLLTASTIRNLNREQVLFEESLLREGLTLIRSFGAGVRMTMRHRMTGQNPIQTLVEETVQEKGVQYIRILRENGEVVAESGDLPDGIEKHELKQFFATTKPLIRTIKKQTPSKSFVFLNLYGRQIWLVVCDRWNTDTECRKSFKNSLPV